VQGSEEERWTLVLQSYVFVVQYLLELYRHRQGPIDVPTIEAVLRSIFPTSRIVGDKFPAYIFRIDNLVETDGLVRVIAYRDCRDVTSSILKMVRTEWRGRPFVRNINTAQKIAERWVHAIELMEHHADKLYIIRYEDMVQEPEQALKILGEWLRVDSNGFPTDMIHGVSVGKHKNGLSKEELAKVYEIAGPTMARLGYL
jgi:hypothetical protein